MARRRGSGRDPATRRGLIIESWRWRNAPRQPGRAMCGARRGRERSAFGRGRLLQGRGGRIGIDTVGPGDLDREILLDAYHLGRRAVAAVLEGLEDRGAQRRAPIDELGTFATKAHEPAPVLAEQGKLGELARDVAHGCL